MRARRTCCTTLNLDATSVSQGENKKKTKNKTTGDEGTGWPQRRQITNPFDVVEKDQLQFSQSNQFFLMWWPEKKRNNIRPTEIIGNNQEAIKRNWYIYTYLLPCERALYHCI